MSNRATDAELPNGSHAPQKFLHQNMTVRQVAHDFPACRQVFERYGEPADRRPFGHIEPLSKFAARHHVPLDRLLQELSEAAGVPVDERQQKAASVHRPFLVCALAITLTLGAGWGAWLLWKIGVSTDFRAVPVRYVVAHGDAQLWGFLSLFITGIALRWLPMATNTQPVSSAHAAAILGALLIGVGLGFLWDVAPQTLPAAGQLSGVALVAATGLIARTVWRRVTGRLREPWVWGVAAAVFWWIVWAAFVLWLRYSHRVSGADDYSLSERNWTIELAVFGLGVNAVYGFGLRLLPGVVGGSARRPRAGLAIALHNLGLLLLCVGHISLQLAAEFAGTLAVAAGAAVYASALPGLRRPRPRDCSNRPEQAAASLTWFVRIAFFWLIAGATLLVIGHTYDLLGDHSMPHAWRGAARHALTVGFLTTLIIGMGHLMVPVLGRTVLAWPQLVLPTLILIAVGNLLRVTTEIATLAWPVAFLVMPASSLLELGAIGLFSANCVRTLWPRDPLLTTGRVTERSSVAVLLAHHPWIEDELIAEGFAYLARARSVPPELTLGSMCRSHGFDPARVVKEINDRLSKTGYEAGSSTRPVGQVGDRYFASQNDLWP